MSTISNTADHAIEAASHARKTLVELSAHVVKMLHSAREAEDRSVDALLGGLGLQRQKSVFRPVLWLAAGAVTAGGAVLLMSSASGKKLRQKMTSLLGGEIEAHETRGIAPKHVVDQPVKSGGSTAKNGTEHAAG
jgi:hypothetical protein